MPTATESGRSNHSHWLVIIGIGMRVSSVSHFVPCRLFRVVCFAAYAA
jgi:hypothetical protein